MSYPIPNFELAPLLAFDRDLFRSENKDRKSLNGTMLALAAIYNDLKNLLWLNDFLVDGSQPDNKITAYLGQQRGMKTWIFRQVISIVHELQNLIQKNNDMVDHSDFQKCVSKLNRKGRDSWYAIRQADSTSLGKFMLRVRNDIGSHYWGTKNFIKGYEEWLKLSETAAKYAYISLGDNMQKTRFFIADAACQSRLEMIYDELEIDEHQIIKIVKDVNGTLRYIIEYYIQDILEKNPIDVADAGE